MKEDDLWDKLIEETNREAFRECPKCGHTLNPPPKESYGKISKALTGDEEFCPILFFCHNCHRLFTVVMGMDNDKPILTQVVGQKKVKKR